MGPTLDKLRRATCADGGTGWTRGGKLGVPGRGCADGLTVGIGAAIWHSREAVSSAQVGHDFF